MRFVYFDDKGKPIGMGEETEIKTPLKKPGAFAVQTIIAANGMLSEQKEEIDEETFTKLKDPRSPLKLSSFKRTK